jgi:hypothetical protein
VLDARVVVHGARCCTPPSASLKRACICILVAMMKRSTNLDGTLESSSVSGGGTNDGGGGGGAVGAGVTDGATVVGSKTGVAICAAAAAAAAVVVGGIVDKFCIGLEVAAADTLVLEPCIAAGDDACGSVFVADCCCSGGCCCCCLDGC